MSELAKIEPVQSVPAPKGRGSGNKRSGNGKAKEAIDNVATRRDASVADVLEMASSHADQKTATRKKALAEKLGDQMADSEIKAIEEVCGFFMETLGNSEWLLEGAREILEGELVE